MKNTLAPMMCVAILTCGCGGDRGAAPEVQGVDVSVDVVRALQRLNAMVGRRDMAIVNEFTDDGDTLIIGSAGNEQARGREEITAFFTKLFASPMTIGWDWKETRVSSAGDVAWIYASGEGIIRGGGSEQRIPYRMSGVLQRDEAGWKWRLFHGSEPAASPEPGSAR